MNDARNELRELYESVQWARQVMETLRNGVSSDTDEGRYVRSNLNAIRHALDVHTNPRLVRVRTVLLSEKSIGTAPKTP